MRQVFQKNRGFSLIEVIFAMVFLSVIVFGVVKLQTSHLGLSNTQQNDLKAHFYAFQALEIISALYPDLAGVNCEDLSPCTFQSTNPYVLQEGGDELLDEGLFQRYFIKQNLPSGYLVTVRVRWEDSTGEHGVETRRVMFETN